MKNFPEQNVLFKVYGKNGKLIQAASDIPSECEVLFKSSTPFIVESVKPIPNPTNTMKTILEITLKEI